MKILAFTFLIWVSGAVASASELCAKSVSERVETLDPLSFSEFEALFRVPGSLKDKAIRENLIEIFKANFGLFIKTELVSKNPGILDTLKVESVKKLADHPHYPYYRGKLTLTHNEREFPIDIFFRSNGSATFLSSTWQLEQNAQMRDGSKIHCKMVVRGTAPFETGENTSDKKTVPAIHSQNIAILKSLPAKVKISRSMSEKEFALWKSGKIDRIQTQSVFFGSAATANPRTTFALNYYQFNGNEPYVFEVDRSVLEDLEEKGHLSFNTYEDATVSRHGMPAEAQTPFGIEVELVIHGREGREAILKIMQNPVQTPTPRLESQ